MNIIIPRKKDIPDSDLNEIEFSNDFDGIVDLDKRQAEKKQLAMKLKKIHRKYGIGNAYIELYTLDESKYTRKMLVYRKYNKQYVEIIFFPEDKFINNIYENDLEEDIKL